MTYRPNRITSDDSWRFTKNGNDLEIQCFIDSSWITKGVIGGNATDIQPPEVDNNPVIFAPNIIVLNYSDPSISKSIEGCSVDDEDSVTLIMDITSTNGSIDLPFSSGADYEEISGGIRFTGSIAQLNIELSGLEFMPINAIGPAPQDGTIDIILNDLDGSTSNANHTITIEVLNFGR